MINVYYNIDDKVSKILEESSDLTSMNYKTSGKIDVNDLITIIEDLNYEINKLNEEIADLEEQLYDNSISTYRNLD